MRVRREPVGVVGAIVPWNFPQTLAFFKIAPALAAGCTLVVKPSPETVLDSVLLAEAAIEAGLPAGVLNIVPGGREVGAHLVAHPGVDKVAFTGSTAAGRQIAETCGRLLRPVTLELGGKSAAIVLDDAELDLATIGNDLFVGDAGQQRPDLLPRHPGPGAAQPVRRGRRRVLRVRGLDDGRRLARPGTQIGPMASERQRDRVEGYIAKGRAEGGRITVGGGRPADRDAGWFVEPTVFADVDNNATIAQEEIFGPVLSVIPYEDEADAIRIANDSDYGLGGTVWTADPERGTRRRRADPHRDRRRQPLPARPGRAVRRHQGQRHRPRAGPGGPRQLPAPQVRLLLNLLLHQRRWKDTHVKTKAAVVYETGQADRDP